MTQGKASARDQVEASHEDPPTMKSLLVDPAKLLVDEELQRLVPQHRKSEIALLERSLVEEQGCREALHVWEQEDGKLIVLDGHTRCALCSKLGFQVPIRKVQLPDKESAKAYVKRVQLGRRNIPAHAEAYLRGSHYNELKQGRGGDRRSKQQADALKDTAEQLAKEYEVSASTIDRDGAFAALLDAVLHRCGMEDRRWQLLSGDVQLNRSAVKKLSLLQGPELKKQVDQLLKHGRLPRREPVEQANSPKEAVQRQVESYVNRLRARNEKLPVAFLKEMAEMLGFKLVEAEPSKKAAKRPSTQSRSKSKKAAK